MELKFISYNCKGFNISKVPYIQKLLDDCNVLFIQESWLYSSQFCLFSQLYIYILYCIVSLSKLLNLYGYNLREFVLLKLYWNTVNIIFLMYHYACNSAVSDVFADLPQESQFIELMSNPLYYKIISKFMYTILNQRRYLLYL